MKEGKSLRDDVLKALAIKPLTRGQIAEELGVVGKPGLNRLAKILRELQQDESIELITTGGWMLRMGGGHKWWVLSTWVACTACKRTGFVPDPGVRASVLACRKCNGIGWIGG